METIAIFTTGGTIDKVYFDAKGGYEVGTPVVRQVLEHARADAGIPVTELLRKDSLEMTAADRAAIRAALAAALATLAPRDRTVLRLHALDGVPLAALATMHGVDRATISRWIAAAREAVYRETRRALAAGQGIAAADFDSFIDVIRSRFEVSLRAALA